MTVQMENDQYVEGDLVITGRLGRPASVDGVPVWTADDAAILLVEASEDGMHVKVSGVGPDGATMVRVTADVDLGEGVTPMELTEGFEITKTAAEGGELHFTQPRDL